MATPKKKSAKKGRRDVLEGIAYVKSSFNNTIVTITDKEGNVLVWGSAGTSGFKGSKKSTAFAAQLTADATAKKAIEMGLKKIEIRVKGPGSGREAAVRSLQASGLLVTAIKDITTTPHNGCRPPKRRRV